MLTHILRCSFRNFTAEIDAGDLIARAHHRVHIMFHQQDGNPLIPDRFYLFHRIGCLCGIHTAHRLIKQNNLGIGRKGIRNSQSSCITLGQVSGPLVGDVRNAHLLEKPHGALFDGRCFTPGFFILPELLPKIDAGMEVATHYHVL